jgi:tetratricopeptide (TPR) repeat protein
MIWRRHRFCMLAALVAFLPLGVEAQTRIEAPGGVAAQTITNSPISIGATPAEQQALAAIFSQQIAVSSDARAKAEARAAELATQLGFTQGAVINFLRIVGEQDVPLEQIGTKLSEIAAKHRELMDRWSVLDMADPATAALAVQARAAIDEGRYDEADVALLRARDQEIAAAHQAEQLERDAKQAAERRWLRAAAADGKLGDLAMTRLRYVDAAQHYAAAANRVPAERHGERREYLEQEAFALYRQGAERGDNRSAALAIDRYRVLARAVDRAALPLDWARTQIRLGCALFSLGERETGTRRLEDAVAAFRLALEETTREVVPLDWAMTQTNLGSALAMLGERETGTVRLEEAVTAFRLALDERPRERAPLAWAMTQMNLGNALGKLGEREGGTVRLEEAVTAFRLALEEWTREQVPLEWATTQLNLGNALQTLGEREAGTGHLEQAVAAYRLALEERTRERVPLEWAMTQANLGSALETLGNREAGTGRLEESVAAYRLALEEATRERVPLVWAQTQVNLGNAIGTLGEREAGTGHLEEAVATWDTCLPVIESLWPPKWVQSVRARRDESKAEIVRRASK